MSKDYFTNAVDLAKDICMKKLHKGDIAVDATMGNGNDTAALAELVGISGKVYAFDIQKKAVENTRKNIDERNLSKQVKLINDGHENMDRYIDEKVKLFIFNLGYLPKGRHDVTTKAATTLKAVEKCLKLIQQNGVIILVIYYGHEQGKIEKDALEGYVKTLNQREYNVVKASFVNQINCPPMLIIIEKR
ncbi:tRNA 5-(aminomethyl)-2-thiouridylate-methyltransferase MnmM [Clostridium sp. JNZ X4-2]